MIRTISYFLKKNAPILFLLIFASIEFFLILRHKSPYVSDSHFYRHIFYQFQGYDFESAREKVLSFIDLSKVDAISYNFYSNINSYKNSLGFFTKRPFYPFIAFSLNTILDSEYWSFLIPCFFAYVGCIYLVFHLSSQRFRLPYALLVTVLFISFYPFLDWSTYFLTDVIGAFFWILNIMIIYYLVKTKHTKWKKLFVLVLGLSLLNREQGLLFVPFLGMLLIFLHIKRNSKQVIKLINSIFKWSVSILIVYLLIIELGGFKSLYDTILYTQNNYGLYSNSFTYSETANYLVGQIIKSHLGFISDLISRHWWFVHTLFGFIGGTFCLRSQRLKFIDLLILFSGISSYFAIFLYPVLSYRYFFPLVFTLCYFSTKLISSVLIYYQEKA